MASGKEISVFLGNSSIFGILACSVTIGSSAVLFMLGSSCSHGDLLGFIFGKYSQVGKVIVRIINLIFLSAMLGGAESLFLDVLNFKGGGVVVAIIALSTFYLGDKAIRITNNLLTPLTIISICIIFLSRNSTIVGSHNPLRPILYATMNSTCAGLYLGANFKDFAKKEICLTGLCITLILSTLFLLLRSIIVGVESSNFPLVSVSLDTNLKYFSIIIVFCAVLTSAICNLRLCACPERALSPFITIAYALLISAFGFGELVSYLYPVVGLVGFIILCILLVRVISMKLKLKKRSVYL
ncbi:MAG: hypothetical protein IJ033_05295 [Clostridia bacterium]|nr:hypothetical protein [Clostridia bacterium]